MIYRFLLPIHGVVDLRFSTRELAENYAKTIKSRGFYQL